MGGWIANLITRRTNDLTEPFADKQKLHEHYFFSITQSTKKPNISKSILGLYLPVYVILQVHQLFAILIDFFNN